MIKSRSHFSGKMLAVLMCWLYASPYGESRGCHLNFVTKEVFRLGLNFVVCSRLLLGLIEGFFFSFPFFSFFARRLGGVSNLQVITKSSQSKIFTWIPIE